MAVYKRGDKGVFYMNFTVNGVRVFRSTGKFTKKEAKLVEAVEKKKLMDEGSLSPQEKASRTKISDAIDQVYTARWRKNKDGDGTHKNALRFITLMGDLPLGSITEEVVYEYVAKLEATKIATATVNRYLAALKTVMRFKRQQADHIRLGKETQGRIRVISRDEEVTILALIRGDKPSMRNVFYHETADLIEVLLDTGMRLSEAINLKYEDVNFKANLISIWVNKGEKPRSVPMTKRVRHILEERQAINGIRVFTITRHQAAHAWNWARKRMGLKADKEFVIHALRHTCASRLVNRGVDLYVVKEYLGHSTIQVTERYAHLSPDKLAHAAHILDMLA
ncbi:tyrosine-type recombinase/integrase [Geomonas sp. Red32]|uniref:tyrosine-type recombinase/integrase n=1 Tax=Geomonas sp. Red32 TaxID=2912856 RepID=UPI00202CE38C|nr:site-specific integrase [Geomonas sp. Red32]MCM0084466.1 tyrosine-type recombinase/integrase [Geomonas sp. Red32]